MQLRNSEQFIKFITDTMEAVKNGDVSPQVANAMANLANKLLHMMSLELKAQSLPGLRKRKPLALRASNGELTE